MRSEESAYLCAACGENEVIGLNDGWPSSSRDGDLICSDCWDYQREHGHWPDESPEACPQCHREQEAKA